MKFCFKDAAGHHGTRCSIDPAWIIDNEHWNRPVIGAHVNPFYQVIFILFAKDKLLRYCRPTEDEDSDHVRHFQEAMIGPRR